MSSLVQRMVAGLSRRTPPFRGKERLLRPLSLTLANKHLVPAHVKSVRCIQGIDVYTSTPTDVMFRELYLFGFYQDDVLVSLRNLLRPGDVFWDVGANYGFMSLYVDRHFAGRVRSLAFEPNPVVLPELYRNIEKNSCQSVEVHELCLSDAPGEVTFYTSSDHSWNATLIKEFAAHTRENVEVKVQATTIDALVKRLPPPSVMKIDVEGAEHLVVQGGSEFLAKAPTPLIAEFNRLAIEKAGLGQNAWLGLFRDLGYHPHLLRRPWVGFHKWSSLHAVADPASFPPGCNLIFLKERR